MVRQAGRPRQGRTVGHKGRAKGKGRKAGAPEWAGQDPPPRLRPHSEAANPKCRRPPGWAGLPHAPVRPQDDPEMWALHLRFP